MAGEAFKANLCYMPQASEDPYLSKFIQEKKWWVAIGNLITADNMLNYLESYYEFFLDSVLSR